MSCRISVCVVQVPGFNPDRMLGGAEVMAVQLVRALATLADVTVLHGTSHPPAPESRAFPGLAARVHAAFPIDEHVREQGHISPRFTTSARRRLASANVVVTVERTLTREALDGAPQAARVACLGGVGYPHTLDVLRHRSWDRLVVPSRFVERQITENVPDARGVTVIENGIDPAVFAPPQARHTRSDRLRLLVASRPGWDKGFRRAIDLARVLETSGTPTTLVCFEQTDGFGPADFTSQLLPEATGLDVEVLTWREHAAMPAVYHGADLTLCLGQAAEGFGLVAAESVACGTPVLASPAGFLAEMFPPDHGLHLVAPDACPADLGAAACEALASGPEQCRVRGHSYVASRYGLDRMVSAFRRLVSDAATTKA